MNGLRPVVRRVEHVDTDAAGVVHFSRYASLMETAILENLESLGQGVTALADDGLDLAVAETHLKYHLPARFPDEVSITVRVDRVGGASCRLHSQIHRTADGETALLASGDLVLCVVDRARGTVAPLPAPLRQTLRDRLTRATA
ncbi:4-hydroxybenzoyl-CoA thioesterase [Streptomyces inusitatus]|uniref:4-hydroxybenzoyl-CoA thioesterase n=1 Tax=Streptomyces inusitatus TaxID=68221 RepID=A0A918V0F0_9ACTN|nr:thioesterase family protein [Streptomyces inusitatus]GGZ48782.1 4-hydroxybenzoyl-CoA thioesterase [Streptomyces inusitatus]